MIMNNPVVQDVFNRVIDGGYYTSSNRFMCHVLCYAECDKYISEEEHLIATNDINMFLKLYQGSVFTNNPSTLHRVVSGTKYHRDDIIYVEIYRDWFKFKEDFIKEYPPMRSMQEVLDVIIDNGFYGADSLCIHMCISANYASREGVISEDERIMVIDEITKIVQTDTLFTYLKDNGIDNELVDRVFIYRNWVNFSSTFNKRFGKLKWKFKIIKNRINLKRGGRV